MLLQRLGAFDRTLRRIKSGAQFIPPKRLLGPEYLAWLQQRPDVLLRLVRAAALHCTSELPSVLAVTRTEADLAELKDSVTQLTFIYEEATKFELEVRGVTPPEAFEEVHRMTFDWSDPVREGVASFVQVLETISKIDVRRVVAGEEQMPNLGIEFPPPPNVDEFLRALKSVPLSSVLH